MMSVPGPSDRMEVYLQTLTDHTACNALEPGEGGGDKETRERRGEDGERRGGQGEA